MAKLIRAFFVGIAVSFVGALPLGTLNIAAMQLAISDGLQPAIAFAGGMIFPDVFYVLLTLLAMRWIQRQKSLFRLLEWVALLLVLALAAANFYAAFRPTVQKNVLLSNTLPPFLLGMVMNGINPMQIPFWLGWNSVLLSKNILQHHWRHYLVYTLSISIGLFAGTSVFIFGGRLVADRISRNQDLLSFAIGLVFLGTAAYYVWKMTRKRKVLQEVATQTSTAPGLANPSDKHHKQKQ